MARGKCRRFPPLVYFDSHSKQPSELWPGVNESWWCGEFKWSRAEKSLGEKASVPLVPKS
jgi:hypothetical protein